MISNKYKKAEIEATKLIERAAVRIFEGTDREHETHATQLLKNFDESTDKLYTVLMKPKGLRKRLLKLLFPELRDVADDLRRCYWH